jgi:hypothetical protein
MLQSLHSSPAEPPVGDPEIDARREGESVTQLAVIGRSLVQG